MVELELHEIKLKKMKKYICPDCGSTNIVQESAETVVTNLNTQQIRILYDSTFQKYSCEDCGFESESSKPFQRETKKTRQTELTPSKTLTKN